MKTLVSLISKQTLPNVLFAKEQIGIDKYIFVTTAYMEKNSTTKHILNALGDVSQDNITTIIVQEDNLEDIATKLEALAFDENEEIIVNMTGGTKIMAIGVYDFFSTKENTKIFYIPFAKNEIVQIFPKDKQNTQLLKYRVSLQDYLKSYNVKFTTDSFNKKNQVFGKSITDNVKKHNKKKNFRDNWGILRERKNNQVAFPLNLNESELQKVKQNLATLKFPTKETGKITEKEAQYFLGGWWEEYLYNHIKEQLGLEDNDIGLNIEINRNDNMRFSASNEFDILFVYQNKLYVIECKTGIARQDLQLFNKFVYKLAALKKFYGLNVKLSLCVLQKLDQSTNKEEFFDQRTNILDISLFEGNDFNDITEFIKNLTK